MTLRASFLVSLVFLAGCRHPEPPVPPRTPSIAVVQPLPAVRPPEPPSPEYGVRLLHRRPAAERREVILEVLRKYPNVHDAYLHLDDIADPASVKVMFRLCSDYQEPKKGAPAGVRGIYVCTLVHLTDVLRAVTNHDPGMWCSDWQSWLAENRSKTWNEWIIDGFAEEGVTASFPLSQPSFRALVRFMADERKWRSLNAWRLLSQLPPEELEQRLRVLGNERDGVVRQGIERVQARLRGSE